MFIKTFDAFSALCFMNDIQFLYMANRIGKYGDKPTMYLAYWGIVMDMIYHLSAETLGPVGYLSASSFIFISFLPYRFIWKDLKFTIFYTFMTILTWALGYLMHLKPVKDFDDFINHPVRGDDWFMVGHGGNHITTSFTYTFYIWWLMKNRYYNHNVVTNDKETNGFKK